MPRKTKAKPAAAEPNLAASLSSYPLPAMAQLARIDVTAMDAVVAQFNAGETIDEKDFRRSMFGMMQHVFTTVGNFETKLEALKADINENNERIKALEDKIGGQEECAIPLSITMQKLAKRSDTDDENLVKHVIKAINAEGVNAEEAVVKVVRKGHKPATATQSERHGTLLVELKSIDVKAKIMKTKKSLASHPGLKEVRISNMKTQSQMNQDFFNRQVLKMIPGGHQYYISGTGALRPQSQQPGQGWQGPLLRAPPPPQHAHAPLQHAPQQSQGAIRPPGAQPPFPFQFQHPGNPAAGLHPVQQQQPAVQQP